MSRYWAFFIFFLEIVMDRYNVTGMSCAACVARVERAVKALPGVERCDVNLLTHSMVVEGPVPGDDIIKAVEAAGYGAEPLTTPGTESPAEMGRDRLEDKELPVLKNRLAWSLLFLLPLLYFSMGHMSFDFPLPRWFLEPEPNHVAMALLQLALTTVVLVINQKFFVNGARGIINRAPNMDSLVALGAGVSYLYSLAVLFAMSRAQLVGGSDAAKAFMDKFFFEGAATIVTLITVGKLLEAISKGRTTNALKALMDLAPKTATLLVGGQEKLVPIDQVQVGDVFVVKPGSSVPVDGIVLKGASAVDESALTGESIPVDKAAGDKVASATVNRSGFLECRATRVGEDTTLSQIIRMVSDASATKAPISKIADKVAGIFVPVVIAIAAVATLVWLLVGAETGFALARGIAVLVISCPCALGLATPVAIMVANGVGARHGILFKTSAALETVGRVRTVVLDKTGTITSGTPAVIGVLPEDGVSESELLRYASALESRSEHPLAKAVTEQARQESEKSGQSLQAWIAGISGSVVPESFEVLPGFGLKATLASGTERQVLLGGSLRFVREHIQISEAVESKIRESSARGETPLLFALSLENGTSKLLGTITVADSVRSDSRLAIGELKSMGLKVCMLTGDNELTANEIARQAGIDRVFAGVLPQGKDDVIRELMESSTVAMVGDGINDAPALTRAHVGFAIGAGSDVALDAADVVLVKNSLWDVVTAIRLSRRTIRNIHENLFWAFIYNVVGIPLAAGCFYHLFGWTLSATFAAFAMSLSSFCVVTNALRLNLFKTKAVPAKGKTMQKKFKVEGMMCPHCEASVKKAVESIDGVESAVADHKKGELLVKFSREIPDSTIADAVKEAGYEFIG